MVYPVYLLFIEHGVHGAVQGLSGLQVMPKGLLDNYPQPSSFLAPQAGATQIGDGASEKPGATDR